MNCYVCAVAGASVPAVATCRHCGVGLCLEHFGAEVDYETYGIHYTCQHDLRPRPAEAVALTANGHSHRWLHAAR